MFCAAKSFSFVQFHPNSSVRCGMKIQIELVCFYRDTGKGGKRNRTATSGIVCQKAEKYTKEQSNYCLNGPWSLSAFESISTAALQNHIKLNSLKKVVR